LRNQTDGILLDFKKGGEKKGGEKKGGEKRRGRRRRGEKVVSDNSKCARTFKEGRGVNLISSVGRYGCFLK
jgi:hypothetical protein